MTKNKHPKDRAERIARRQKEHEKKLKTQGASKVRRQLIESLKERETEDELQQQRHQGSVAQPGAIA